MYLVASCCMLDAAAFMMVRTPILAEDLYTDMIELFGTVAK